MRISYRAMLENIRDEINVVLATQPEGEETIWAVAFVRTMDGGRSGFHAHGVPEDPSLPAARAKMIEMWSVPPRPISELVKK